MRIILFTVLFFSVSCSNLSPVKRDISSIPEIDLEAFALDDDSEDQLSEVESVKEGIFARWFDGKVGFFQNFDKPVALELIKKSKKTIDIEIYEMKDPVFRSLLISALKRGVKVRIVKDPTPVGDGCDELGEELAKDKADCKEDRAYIRSIQKLGASYVYFNKKKLCAVEGKSCFQHGKMLITDNKYLLLSTGNFNPSSFCTAESKAIKCNRDYSYVTKNKKVISYLKDIFEKDITRERWNLEGVISEGHKAVTVSPFSRPRLISIIKSAQKSLLIQNQYLEDPELNQAISDKAAEGLDVRVMVSDFCQYGRPKANKKMKTASIYTAFDQTGVKTRIFTPKIKVKDLPGYLHAKAIVVDEKFAWFGSVNGSVTSTTKNREFGIIFKGRKSVKKLVKIMKADFDHAGSLSWQQSLACEKPSSDSEVEED